MNERNLHRFVRAARGSGGPGAGLSAESIDAMRAVAEIGLSGPEAFCAGDLPLLRVAKSEDENETLGACFDSSCEARIWFAGLRERSIRGLHSG